MMKFLKTLLASFIFVFILFFVYFIHVTFLRVDVVFYSAIIDALVAAGLSAIIIYAVKFFGNLGLYEKFLLVCIWVLAGYAFAISVPTVLDRSLSFYILEKLQQRGGGIQVARMPDVFTQEYMKEHRLVDVRLTEQAQSGTIEIVDGCVKLTPKGERIASVSRFFRLHLLPKKRLLMGEYTDDLTNPFRNSIETPDYLCQ
ncbi:MAG: hypothetical protein EBS82_06280 [Methylocystaceae bacterium]|nr:hypothetical protein [Methylocystaceae bacterium]NBT97398.1 hypothetical protein [Methylocystaceae bacterium]